MPYYTIPQRLERLRRKSALESARRSIPPSRSTAHPAERRGFLAALHHAKRELEAQLARDEHRLTLLNDLIAMYEK